MAKQGLDLLTLALVLTFVGVFIALYYNEQKRKVVHEAFASGNMPNFASTEDTMHVTPPMDPAY